MEAKQLRLPAQNQAEFLIISYPKCGRTWLRLMLGRVFQTHFGLTNANLLELHELAQLNPNIPKIWVSHDDKPQWKKPDELVTDKGEYQDKKVILLVRDPRDVVVSNYFQKTKRRKVYDGSLSDYLQESLGSFDTILRFYNIWADNRTITQKFILVRYEDLH
ncbi:MAG TPA: sulfotransferase, partial [Cyanobacteria bacterium UBA11166]|nr:sulfotransferase [Cyanobacteria bacterium UBA11166]